MTDKKALVDANLHRIPKKPPYNPAFLPTTEDGLQAKCPLCGRITSIRICYGCKALMCEECLTEHQVKCLHQEKRPGGCSRCHTLEGTMRCYGSMMLCQGCIDKALGNNGEDRL